MDPEGEGQTNTGRICGMISTLLGAVVMVGCCSIYLIFFAAAERRRDPPTRSRRTHPMSDTISCRLAHAPCGCPRACWAARYATCRETFTAALEDAPPRKEASPPPPPAACATPAQRTAAAPWPRRAGRLGGRPRRLRPACAAGEAEQGPGHRRHGAVGGILAMLLGVGLTLGGFPVCCLWPGRLNSTLW